MTVAGHCNDCSVQLKTSRSDISFPGEFIVITLLYDDDRDFPRRGDLRFTLVLTADSVNLNDD